MVSTGNPFYVHPGNALNLGLRDMGNQLESRAQVELKRANEQKQQEQLRTAGRLIQANDMQGLQELMVTNPGISEHIKKSINFKNDLTEKNAAETAFKLLSGEDPQQVLSERVDFLTRSGADPSGTIKLMQTGTPEEIRQMAEITLMSADEGLYKTWKDSTTPGGDLGSVAAVQEMEYLTQGMSPQQKQQARLVRLGLSPRASETAQIKAEKAFATEVAKLNAQLGLEPRVAAAVASAKNQAKAEADQAVKSKSDKKAWDVYNAATKSLSSSMQDTATGPLVGLIPAMTESQQIADGALALMAPIMKDVFRSAGEGTFAKDDQDRLMAILPDRTDKPAARIAKIKQIDNVIRFKLGQPLAEDLESGGDSTDNTSQASGYSEGQTATGPKGEKMIFRNGGWEALQ